MAIVFLSTPVHCFQNGMLCATLSSWLCQRFISVNGSIILVWGEGGASCTMSGCIKASWWKRETGMRDMPFTWGNFTSFSSLASFARTWISHQHGLLGACSTAFWGRIALATENFGRVGARAEIGRWGHIYKWRLNYEGERVRNRRSSPNPSLEEAILV